MSIQYLLNTVAVIYRQSFLDEDSEPTVGAEPAFEWAQIATLACRMYQRNSREINTEVSATRNEWKFIFPAGADIAEGDRVVCQNMTTEITGINKLPGGVAHSHIECLAKEVK